MPKKKRSMSKKKFSIFSKKALTILSVAALLVLTPLFIYLSAKGFEGIATKTPDETKRRAQNIQSGSQNIRLSQQSGEAEAATRDENITEIDNASSELNGKWRGVCAKNSVQTVEDFRKIVENDPVLSIHFAGFNWPKAVLGKQAEETHMYVTHRKGPVIKETTNPIRLPKGDGYITDGVRSARTYCCNDISLTPSAGTPDMTPSAGSPTTTVPTGPFFTDIPYHVPPAMLATPFLTSHTPSNDIPTIDPTPDPDPDPDPTPIPEPGSLLLAGIGLTALVLARRKKRCTNGGRNEQSV